MVTPCTSDSPCRDLLETTLLRDYILSTPDECRDKLRRLKENLGASSMTTLPKGPGHGTVSKEDNTSSLLLQLPSELMRHMFGFMDIPMLGNLAQVHQGLLRDYACSDIAWGPLVQHRFAINPYVKRPKLNGGKDWKDAYRSMHACHRLPKCRLTSRKSVFAKGHNNHNHRHPKAVVSEDNHRVAMWVLLNHREDCKSRTISVSNCGKYVDFWVCLQNTRSNGATVKLDVMDSEIQLLNHGRDFYTEPCLQEPVEDSNGFRSWILPRLVYRSSSSSSSSSSSNNGNGTITSTTDEGDISQGIDLKPFEFCIVSIPFECGQDVFETDFLARTWAMRVPFTIVKESDEMDMENSIASTVESMKKKTYATAWFLRENEIWNHYCELPGGCLTLSDRDTHMHL